MVTDLILFNANIITMDTSSRKDNLIAIRNGKIGAVTTNDALQDLKHRHTKVVDCSGKTVLPGFIDPHFHLHAFAEHLVTLNLSPRSNVHSISDLQAKVRTADQELPPGSWLRGKGYDEFYLEEKRHPNRWDLDEVATAHPIKLTHRSGHAHVLNSLALELVGISRETPDPPGGLIDRDIRTGEPTGLLYELSDILSKKVPPLDNDQLERGIKMANQELLSLGITSIQDASLGNDMERWRTFDYWKESGLLKPRVSMMLGVKCIEDHIGEDFSGHFGENRPHLKGTKLILDETTGQLYPPQSELNEMVLKIHQRGLQVAIHAIEENAVESACAAIEYALQKFPRFDHRHRIEHCSVCTPILAKRLASLGIMVVTQPPFVFYNGDRYLKTVLPWQIRYLYPIKTLMENGVRVAASSDCPMVPLNPLIGIYAAVSRMTENGNVVVPEERISPLEALRMYTFRAAQTTFEETIKGSITPGKLADLVMINGNPIKAIPNKIEEIKNMKVVMTILNGEVVWNRED